MDERPTIEPIKKIEPKTPKTSDETVVSASMLQVQIAASVPPSSEKTASPESREIKAEAETMPSSGIMDSSLADSLRGFARRLAEALEKAADDITSLEVSTYISSELESVKYDLETKKLTGQLKLRAYTHIAFDGDTQIALPDKGGSIDQAVWDVHIQMVKEAQANRAAFLQTMAEMASKLVGILK